MAVARRTLSGNPVAVRQRDWRARRKVLEVVLRVSIPFQVAEALDDTRRCTHPATDELSSAAEREAERAARSAAVTRLLSDWAEFVIRYGNDPLRLIERKP